MKLKVINPLKCTGGVLSQWNNRPALRVKEPLLGDIIILDYGNGQGHTGFVTAVNGEWVDTIEGNTNSAGSREGDGVYRKRRLIKNAKGFLRMP